MEGYKVFNDPIHKSVKMPPYCQMIIDTPEFQRLRFIKQLGCTCYVFPSAVHTRFEHSLGVSYLAGKLANMLRQDDPNMHLNTDVICVQIAGLCLDLGYGPFSYVFEDIVPTDKKGNKWSHKEQSIIVFEHMIEQNKLKEKLAKYDINEHEIDFICDIILGRPRGKGSKLLSKNWFYLHQIVNNSVNAIDVNNWDYIARDALYLGINSAFDFSRITPFIKVLGVERIEGETRKELCFRDKVANDLNQMLLTRRRLHYAAYQHRVTRIISIMLKDALRAAADHLIFVGKDGEKYNLLESVKDPMAFRQVNDTIVNEIMRSTSQEPGIVKAQAIINRIHNKRQLYQCIGTWQHDSDVPIKRHTLDAAEIKREIVEDSNELWHCENIEVEVSYFDYGDGKKNPLLNIPFYGKSEGNTGRGMFLPKEKLSVDLPERLQDVTVTVYTKVPDVNQDTLKKARKTGNERLRCIIEKIISPLQEKKKAPISLPRRTDSHLKHSISADENKDVQKVIPIVKSPILKSAASLAAPLDDPTVIKAEDRDVHPYVEETKTKDDSGSEESLSIDLRDQNANVSTYGEITVEKLTETPADLPLQDDEVVISYGLQITSHGSEISSSVMIRMPHCAIFTNPEEAEIVLYTRDNGSGKFTMFTALSSGNDGTPRCVVREKDLDLYMNHFSSWWIVAVIRSYFIGKRFVFTPYVPTPFCRSQVNCIYMFLKEGLRLEEEHPDGFKKAFAKEEFHVEWRQGNVKIKCYEDDTEIATKILTKRRLRRCNYEHLSFVFEARETREPRAIITFKLEQSSNTKEIQFPIDFEVSTPTQSPQYLPSFQADDVLQESQQSTGHSVSERTLLSLAEDIGNDNKLPKLALELGITYERWLRYSAVNTRRDNQICSDGTCNMLVDWKSATATSEQIPKLKEALREAGFVELEEKYFGIYTQ